jgi:multicomponent Na+:H+ antiporter subunit B
VIGRHESEVVRSVGWLLTPFVLMFGLYVVAHGHYGPGGGFAGGVVLAVGVILVRITTDDSASRRAFPTEAGPALLLLGMGMFVAAGLIPMLAGGAFLDYGEVAWGTVEPSRMRYLGILVVEVGIGLAVFGALLWIFEVLIRRGRS